MKTHHILHQLSLPIIAICRCVPAHKWIKRHHLHAIVGTCVMFGGCMIAKLPVTGFMHYCCDVVGYSIHAIGLPPVLALFGMRE